MRLLLLIGLLVFLFSSWAPTWGSGLGVVVLLLVGLSLSGSVTRKMQAHHKRTNPYRPFEY